MRVLAFLLLAANLFAVSVPKEQFIKNTLSPAVFALYRESENGNFEHVCTATAFKKTTDGYRLLTAAHCVEEEEQGFFFVGKDEPGDQMLLRVKAPMLCGTVASGTDFCIMDVITKDDIPVVPLGTAANLYRGKKVLNVSLAHGLGKFFFEGVVALPKLNRPGSGKFNWDEVIVLQMSGISMGSSGSAIVCEDEQTICGIFAGTFMDEPVAIPIDRVKPFLEEKAKTVTPKFTLPNPDKK